MVENPTNLYSEKTVDYFTRARTEIAPLLPVNDKELLRVLEIGCSEGHTLEWLKKTGRCSWAAGVEPYADLRTSPGAIDQFFRLDIEKIQPDLPPASVDVILCLDVLEHLINPWDTLRKIDILLKPGGMWIISIPNLRNYHILSDLVFRGRFDYVESGILDKTHLRFFTRYSAIEMIESVGAKVIQIFSTETGRWQKRMLMSLGLGDLLAKQFIIKAEKLSL